MKLFKEMKVFVICCFLAFLTGVVVIEGEQEVDQLKTIGKNPQILKVEEDSRLTGEEN